MKIRAVKKEEYDYTEMFVCEVFKNTGRTDGEYEKAWLKKIREKQYYIPELDIVVEEKERLLDILSSQNFQLVKITKMKC